MPTHAEHIPSFQRLAILVLRPHKRSHTRTYSVNRISVRHLSKVFWGRPATDLDGRLGWDMYLEKMRAQRVTRNLNNERKLWIQICFLAYQRGYIRVPPIKIPIPNHPSEKGRELTRDEISRLFLNCGDETLHFQMELALTTGLRENEMLSLKHSYIDYEKSAIRLPALFAKGGKKGRVIPIRRYLLEKFRSWKKKSSSEFIFVDDYTAGVRRTKSTRKWLRLKELAEVECRWHDFRHTCATQNLRAGISVEIIGKVLGMSRDVLLRIYAHLNEDDLRPCAEAVDLSFIKTG